MTERMPTKAEAERQAMQAWSEVARRVADIKRGGRQPPQELVERALVAAQRLCQVRGRKRGPLAKR